MKPEAFLKTIYVGDRGCKGLIIDSWQKRLKIQIDLISRVRDSSGHWNYYDLEDIQDGYLVFDGLRGIRFDPSGPIPNDYINSIDVSTIEGEDGVYKFCISVSSVDSQGESQEVTIGVLAVDCYLEDPKIPGQEIR
jgi:hypothetical protein